MPTYRRKNSIVEAAPWWKNGDHPDDNCVMFRGKDGVLFAGEGNIVRYYRHPEIPGDRSCARCGFVMNTHGWMDTGGSGRTVCPGDWVVTLPNGQRYAIKAVVFEETFEPT